MAEEPSFLGIIDRIRAEGDLDRNKGSNSIKSLKGEVSVGNEKIVDELDDISISAKVQTNSLHDLRDAIVGNDLAKAEKDREQKDLLQDIADGTNKPNKEIQKSEEKKSKGFFAGLLGFFSKFKGFLTPLIKLFKGPLLKIFGGLGTVFKRVFLPITLAIGVFKGITEGIKGYKEGGIMGAIEGFFRGFIDGLVGDVPELLKGLISKVAGFFGLDAFAEMLNKTIDDIVVGVKSLFTGIFNSLVGLFTGDTELFQQGLFDIIEGVKGIFTGIKDAVMVAVAEFGPTITAFFIDTAIPFLKDTLLPKITKVATNIVTVLSETFMDIVAFLKEKIRDIIPDIGGGLKKGLGKVGSFFGFGGEDPEALDDMGFDTTQFNESQKEALNELNTALAEEDDLEKRLALIRKFDQKRKLEMSDEDNLENKEFINAVRLVTSSNFDAQDVKNIVAKQNRNNSGAQMESGMSNIADSRAKPATVVVTGGGGGGRGQGTTVNSSNITYNGNQHADESNQLTRPSYSYAPA